LVTDTAPVGHVADMLSVRSPAAPVLVRLVTLAGPRPLVAAVGLPPYVPAPVAIAAVTVTPAWLTAFPAPSRSCTTGCWANVTPLCAVAEGWVVSVNWLAAPAPTVIVPETAGVSPVAGSDERRGGEAVVIGRLGELGRALRL